MYASLCRIKLYDMYDALIRMREVCKCSGLNYKPRLQVLMTKQTKLSLHNDPAEVRRSD